MQIVYSAKNWDLKAFPVSFFTAEGVLLSTAEILAQDMRTAQVKADRMLSTMADADYYEVSK